MTTTTRRTVMVIDDGAIQKELIANAAITPGMLVERMSTGKVRKHATAGGNSQRAFAIENDLEGEEVETDIDSGDICRFKICQRGNEVYAWATTSQTLNAGDAVESAGNGFLRKHTTDSAGVVSYPEAIVGFVLEACTTTSAAGRLLIEVV